MVDTSFGELLRINLDIYFPELACDFVTIDVLDVTGSFFLLPLLFLS